MKLRNLLHQALQKDEANTFCSSIAKGATVEKKEQQCFILQEEYI